MYRTAALSAADSGRRDCKAAGRPSDATGQRRPEPGRQQRGDRAACAPISCGRARPRTSRGTGRGAAGSRRTGSRWRTARPAASTPAAGQREALGSATCSATGESRARLRTDRRLRARQQRQHDLQHEAERAPLRLPCQVPELGRGSTQRVFGHQDVVDEAAQVDRQGSRRRHPSQRDELREGLMSGCRRRRGAALVRALAPGLIPCETKTRSQQAVSRELSWTI